MEPPSIDWSTAQVSDGKLTVKVSGEPPSGWKERFKRTAALLGSGEWEEIRLKKGEIHVKGVPPETEDKLRHHLESLVTEANAVVPEPEPEPEEASESEPEPEEDGEDAKMTEKFRSFAERGDAQPG